MGACHGGHGLANNVTAANVQAKLQRRLRLWCQQTLLGFELKVEWTPDEHRIEEGRVKDNTIFIFSPHAERALEILDHEFLDWLVTKAITPYQHIINAQRVVLNSLFKHIEDQAYTDKELVIDALVKLLNADLQQGAKE